MPTTYLIRNTIPTDDDCDTLDHASEAERIERDAERLGLDPFTYCATVLADEHYGSNRKGSQQLAREYRAATEQLAREYLARATN